MKRLIPAAILLIIVVVTYLSSLAYIDKICDKSEKLLSDCEESYTNNSDSLAAAKKLSKYWSYTEGSLSFFVDHDRIDDIELEISNLKLYSKTENEILFYEHIETLKMLFHQVKEDTRPTFHSVF